MIAKRQNLELAKADLLNRLGEASTPAHRTMLERALAAVETQISSWVEPVPVVQ